MKDMIGKFYIYEGENPVHKGKKVEVVSINEVEKTAIVCDCETTENFFLVKLEEFGAETTHKYK